MAPPKGVDTFGFECGFLLAVELQRLLVARGSSALTVRDHPADLEELEDRIGLLVVIRVRMGEEQDLERAGDGFQRVLELPVPLAIAAGVDERVEVASSDENRVALVDVDESDLQRSGKRRRGRLGRRRCFDGWLGRRLDGCDRRLASGEHENQSETFKCGEPIK
jgi:hypothetical protein